MTTFTCLAREDDHAFFKSWICQIEKHAEDDDGLVGRLDERLGFPMRALDLDIEIATDMAREGAFGLILTYQGPTYVLFVVDASDFVVRASEIVPGDARSALRLHDDLAHGRLPLREICSRDELETALDAFLLSFPTDDPLVLERPRDRELETRIGTTEEMRSLLSLLVAAQTNPDDRSHWHFVCWSAIDEEEGEPQIELVLWPDAHRARRLLASARAVVGYFRPIGWFWECKHEPAASPLRSSSLWREPLPVIVTGGPLSALAAAEAVTRLHDEIAGNLACRHPNLAAALLCEDAAPDETC